MTFIKNSYFYSLINLVIVSRAIYKILAAMLNSQVTKPIMNKVQKPRYFKPKDISSLNILQNYKHYTAMKIKLWLVALCVIVPWYALLAQKAKPGNDTLAIMALLNKADELYRTKTDSSIVLSQKALEWSKKINYARGMGRSHTMLGVSYKLQGQYQKSIEHHTNAVKICEKTNNLIGLSTNLNGIGTTYSALEQNDMALTYFEKALVIKEKLGQPREIAAISTNIGNVYRKKNDFETAMRYYVKGMRIYQTLNDSIGQISTLLNIGVIYDVQNQWDKALANYDSCTNFFLRRHQYFKALTSINNAAIIKTKQGKTEESLRCLLHGAELAKSHHYDAELMRLRMDLYMAYKSKGDLENAFKNLEEFSTLRDSLFGIESVKKIMETDSRLKMENLELEIQSQKSKSLALEKQALAEHLLSMAREEKDKRKADSLITLAWKTQVEADKLRVSEEKMSLENQAKSLALEKSRHEGSFLRTATLLIGIGFLGIAVFVAYVFQSLAKEKAANTLITNQKQEIQALNANLERLVMQRTQKLEERNAQLAEYAFFNAHVLRKPIANILGLIEIFKMENDNEEREEIIEYISVSADELNEVVNQIQTIVSGTAEQQE